MNLFNSKINIYAKPFSVSLSKEWDIWYYEFKFSRHFTFILAPMCTHLYMLKESCIVVVLLLKINLFLSLGEKSITLSSISVFPWNKGNLLKSFLTTLRATIIMMLSQSMPRSMHTDLKSLNAPMKFNGISWSSQWGTRGSQSLEIFANFASSFAGN